MLIQEIIKDVYNVGVRDWDRRLFDELIPLPDGTSYNAYLIKGKEKTALIDTVDPRKSHELLANLDRTGTKRIDYVIANHAEPDHSGTLVTLIEKYPDIQLVTNKKCQTMLMNSFDIAEEQFLLIEEGDTISLGDKTLEFIDMPWVHWPETFVTYLQEEKTLFSCDLFGSHLATTDKFVTDESELLEAAKRYYAEIMMPFAHIIKKHLQKLQKYEIDIIAPSHGPIYDNPELIVNVYNKWVSDETENVVVIPYISMYGSTEEMIYYLMDQLVEAGIKVELFRLTKTDIGDLAKALVMARTVIFGSPTVLTGPHPQVAYAALLANALRPKAKYASIVGSMGWAGRMVEKIQGLLPNLKAEIFSPVTTKGKPNKETFEKLDELAAKIIEKHS